MDGNDAQMMVTLFLQRVTVMHLTIVFGMFAMAIVGRARALFAVFTGLKVIADISRRIR